MKKIYYFLKYFGRLNYYKGIEKLSFLDIVYKRRLGFSTSWRLAKLIVNKNHQL